MSTGIKITHDLKEQILDRVKNKGVSATQAASEAGISSKTIYNWLRKGLDGTVSSGDLTRLRRENQALICLLGKLTVELSKFKKNYR